MRIYFTCEGLNFWTEGPDKCPHCGRDFSAEVLSTVQSPNDDWLFASILACRFCNKFSYIDVAKPPQSRSCKNNNFYPQKVVCDLPYEIETYYPEFINIYKQSLDAEAANLHDICGMGFRKALEILVRQYVFDKYPNDIKKMEKLSIANLTDKIDNPIIKELSAKIRRLGNDQVHTGQLKNPDYGINDIKNFLQVLCYHILMEKQYEKAKSADIK